MVWNETVRLKLFLDDVVPGDLNLLQHRVARQMQHLQAVQQGCADSGEAVRSCDEHGLGQVKGQIQVVVSERAVLFWVQHFQQRSRRVSPVVR